MYQGWRGSLAMSVCGRFDSDLLHDENISKNKGSSITLDKLLDKINEFEKRFKK